MGLDADLIAYYDAEARGELRVVNGPFRTEFRRRFNAMLRDEQRCRLVDVGCGPGLDTVAWQADGFDVVGVDLVRANVELMRRRGLAGVAGSLYQLPIRDRTFDALWTMSTFVHVPDDRVDEAIAEMMRVVRPGGLLGIGTWGGLDFEGTPEFGELRPYRFFSLASHERWRATLARHARVELFDTYDPQAAHGWQYQFAIVRAPI